MRSIVCYHYPCPDGIYAALCAQQHFAQNGGTVHWKPLTTFKAPSVEDVGAQADDTVCFLDYTGPPGFPEQVACHAGRVVVLDHHKTAQESLSGRSDLPGNVCVHIDMERSGATLARDFFGSIECEEVARCIAFIEDGDLWRWRLPGARAFYAGLKARGLEYDANANPQIFDTLLGLRADALIAQGEIEVEREEKLLAEFMAQKTEIALGGAHGKAHGWGSCCAVRSERPALAALRSELGNRLAEASAALGLESIGLVAYPEKERVQAGIGDASQVKVSLRGKGDVDTTRISQHYGGGGHKLASSFIISGDELELW